MAYLTPDEIERGIQAEYDKHYEKLYTGKLPENVLEHFRKALMFVVTKNYRLHSAVTKKILASRPDELTIGQAGIVLNIITDVPYEKRYATPEEAIEAQGEIEDITLKYNMEDIRVQNMLNAKKDALYETYRRTKVIANNGSAFHR